MQTDLLSLKVEKRPSRLRFEGRVLYLVDDGELMRRQLEGEDLELDDALRAKLRDQISTDEITPAYICYYFDETLGEFPYLGLRDGGEFPVKRGLVRKGGFVCSVSGKRRGKGSSREQSPYAEMMAGIRVVIAENIERIYNENCQNLGMLTSTDFSLIERIRRGEEIELSEFTAGLDAITREIIEFGGLFEYNVARLQGRVSIPRIESMKDLPESRPHDAEEIAEIRGAGENGSKDSRWTPEMQAEQVVATTQPAAHPPAEQVRRRPDCKGRHGRRCMTIAEKIFASRWVVDASKGWFGVPWVQSGDSGFVRTDLRFSHEYVSPMAAIFFEEKLGRDAKVTEPESILIAG